MQANEVFACAMLWTGNAGSKVSTSGIVGFRLDLNLFRSKAASGLAIGVVASSPFSLVTTLRSSFFACSSAMLAS